MEATVFALVFVLALAAYVHFSVRAGLAEDADWSRQHALTGHAVRLGLAATERPAGRSDLLAPSRAPERLPVAITPPEPVRGARRIDPADTRSARVAVPEGNA